MQNSGHYIATFGPERGYLCHLLAKVLETPATFVTCGEIPRANILAAMDFIITRKQEFLRYFPNLDFRRTSDTDTDSKGRGKAFKQSVEKINVILRTCSVLKLKG
jgi:hypothetical protein